MSKSSYQSVASRPQMNEAETLRESVKKGQVPPASYPTPPGTESRADHLREQSQKDIEEMAFPLDSPQHQEVPSPYGHSPASVSIEQDHAVEFSEPFMTEPPDWLEMINADTLQDCAHSGGPSSALNWMWPRLYHRADDVDQETQPEGGDTGVPFEWLQYVMVPSPDGSNMVRVEIQHDPTFEFCDPDSADPSLDNCDGQDPF